MLSSQFLGLVAAAVVACSAGTVADETTSASTSDASNEEGRATNPTPGNASTAGDAERDGRALANTASDSGGANTGDERGASHSGEAGPSPRGDSEAGASVGNDAGANGYDPCPPKGTPCAVMPLGDSITFGVDATLGYNMSNGGYRTHLFDLAQRGGKSITFVGSLSNGPDSLGGVPFPKAHEGHPGWVIIQITDIVVGVMQACKPKIITLMIGTNDINAGFDPPDAPNRLGKLIDTILVTDPQVLLVVAKLVPTQTDAENAKFQTYNSAIGDLVATRSAAGKHVTLVDMYAAFGSGNVPSYLSDNLHPDDAGYKVMADTWFGSMGPLLR